MHPALRPKVEHDIATCGQHLIGVFPTVENPVTPFVYTIGNAEKGLPELLVLGAFDPNVVGSILNFLGDKMRAAGCPLPEFVDLGGLFPVKIRTASEAVRSEYTVQAGQYLGREDYEVQQVLLCDKSGVYPGDEGINPAYDVPLV